jgi:putative tricarboxylic transport membrane protein
VGRRQADVGVALLLLVLAVLVAVGALQLDIGWGMNGPKGGFFPFWLAVGLALCCLVILVQAFRDTSPASNRPLVRPGGWAPLLKVAAPATAMVALTEVIGLYLAAALYIGFYMRWIGKHPWFLVVAVSIGVPLSSYLIFDKWLLIPIPKGWWGGHLNL